MANVSDNQFIGIGNFIAYISVDESESLSASIPDVAVETGLTIADTVFIKPKIINIAGEVSDVHIRNEGTNEPFFGINNIISQVTPYLPNRINSEIDKIQKIGDTVRNALEGVQDALSKGRQFLEFFGNKNKTNTENFLESMRGLHSARLPISIETRTGVHDNMVIESIEFRTNNIDGRIVFKMTFKQIRLVELKQFPFAKNPSKGLGGQTDAQVKKGVNQGEEANTSILFDILR